MKRLLPLLLLVLSTTASATTYWIDNSKSGGSGCGTSDANACATYGQLIQQQAAITSNTSTPDTINFVGTGTAYHGNGLGGCVALPFDRTASSILTLQCTDASGTYTPHGCIVDNQGVQFTGGEPGLVFFGNNGPTGPTCNGDSFGSASFMIWRGIDVQNNNVVSSTLIRIKGGSSNHIAVRDTKLDGRTVQANDSWLTDSGASFISFINGTSTNCKCTSGGFGCLAFQHNVNVAVVGNHLGPFRGGQPALNTNNDGMSNIGGHRWLVDGNTVSGMSDGIDHSMLSDGNVLADIITRYNDVFDIWGAATQSNDAGNDHHFKYSGDAPSATDTGPAIWYKNVTRFTDPTRYIGAYFITERSKNADFWYETTYGPWHRSNDGTNREVFLDPGTGKNTPMFYGLFDGPDSVSGGFPLGVNGNCDASCRWVGNGIWFPNLTNCMTFWNGSSFTCANMGTTFNSVSGNSANVHANPHFKLRSDTSQSLDGLSLTSLSTDYIDHGDSFCHASSSGSGNTINVSCGQTTNAPFNDAHHYFPDPNDYFQLQNSDCYGKGVRSSEANGSQIGCFDIQIQGCPGTGAPNSPLTSVRTIRAGGVTATAITFDPPCASWGAGAMVHVPWVGSAPDVGAIEFLPSGPTTTSSTSTSTTNTNPTTSTSTSSSSSSLPPLTTSTSSTTSTSTSTSSSTSSTTSTSHTTTSTTSTSSTTVTTTSTSSTTSTSTTLASTTTVTTTTVTSTTAPISGVGGGAAGGGTFLIRPPSGPPYACKWALTCDALTTTTTTIP